MKKILKLVLIIFMFLFVSFLSKQIYTNIHKNNISNINWIRKNIKITNNTFKNNLYSVSKNKDINTYTKKYQTIIDEKLNELLKNNYIFNNPLIIYNLYDTNKLSFNLYFNTDRESSIDYKISVKGIPDYSKTLYNDSENNLTKKHKYQLIGFVPGYINTLTIYQKDKNNKIINTKKIRIDLTKIKCNSKTKLENTSGDSKNELSDGLYTILGNDSDNDDYISLYDNDGIIRGEIPIIGYRAHSILFNKNKMYFSISQHKIAEIDNLGKINEIYNTGKYYLHHDYIFDKDNNLLVLAGEDKDETDEDRVIKIDLKTKKITEVLNFKNILKTYMESCEYWTSDNRDGNEDGLDWLHLNSLELVNNDLILSSRKTSSIIKIKNYNTNPKLDYILADKTIWENTDFKSYVYNKLGNFTIHAGQHSVRYSNSENSGIYYLTLYNNNYGKANSKPNFDYSNIGIKNTTTPLKGDLSYYYKYKIDENNKTFELIEKIEVPYSGIVSSVQNISNGNIVIDSGTAGYFGEYDSNNNLIKSYIIKLNKIFVYRVLKYDFKNFYFK